MYIYILGQKQYIYIFYRTPCIVDVFFPAEHDPGVSLTLFLQEKAENRKTVITKTIAGLGTFTRRQKSPFLMLV